MRLALDVQPTNFVDDLGIAFVDDWVVSKEKGRYWLSDDIVGLVGRLAM